MLPLFLLLDNKSPPLVTLKASADNDSDCRCELDVNTWLPLQDSLFEHSLPTLSLITLEEAHSKLLLRLVAEEVDKEVDDDVDVKDEDGTDDDVENEDGKDEE